MAGSTRLSLHPWLRGSDRLWDPQPRQARRRKKSKQLKGTLANAAHQLAYTQSTGKTTMAMPLTTLKSTSPGTPSPATAAHKASISFIDSSLSKTRSQSILWDPH